MWSLLNLLHTVAAADPLYDWSASPLVKLDDDNFASEVTKDTKHVWVVEFYADWCGHCKNLSLIHISEPTRPY